MASFEKRGKRTRVVVSVMQDGVRRKVSKTFDTKKAATDWAILMEADKLQDKSIIASRMTFADYFKQWMELYKKNEVKYTSYRLYEYTLDQISTIFSGVALGNLNYAMLQKRLDKLGEQLSQNTLKVVVSRIKASLKDALYDDYINDDFFSRLKPHGIVPPKRENFLSASEFEKLRKYLYKNLKTKSDLAILISLETGMRIGEVLALQYKDVSSAFNNIHVSKTKSSIDGGIGKPKTPNSIRDIKITTDLVTKIGTSKNLNDFIFEKTNHSSVTYRLNAIKKKLQLTDITVHGLRHSHASYLLYNGVSINYVSHRLGHANIAITQKVYAHMLKEEKNREQDKTMKLLSVSPNVPKAKLSTDI